MSLKNLKLEMMKKFDYRLPEIIKREIPFFQIVRLCDIRERVEFQILI